MSKKGGVKYKANIDAITKGKEVADRHPLIRSLPDFSLIFNGDAAHLYQDAFIKVTCEANPYPSWSHNRIRELALSVWPNIRRRAEPDTWAYIFARLRIHIALNHLDPLHTDIDWHFACWLKAEQLISLAGVGRRPEHLPALPQGFPRGDEASLAQYFMQNKVPGDVKALSLGREGYSFWNTDTSIEISDELREQRQAGLAKGIRAAASAAIDVAAGVRRALGQERNADTVLKRAKSWVISEFPLLASLASSFTLIEDEAVCLSMGVFVAAISDQAQEIYFNPRVQMSQEEARFVMTHEFLHVGLRHTSRRQGRDAWYWNVACDYVINDWLLEMNVGQPPEQLGYLHDIRLRGQSAEEIYDKIVSDLRWMRKLKKARTMNGSSTDMLDGQHKPGWWLSGGLDLDSFYRRALTEGLELHLGAGRGLLPAGLVEEIRSLNQPPIPWDVELGQWLDQFFPPLEKRRTFSRAHRRQSATPDIVRPAWVSTDEQRAGRVFAAIVDTSGSMSRSDLGKAIGAIASYAMSRDVGFVRLIHCDARAYDAGYIEPESLLDRVQIKGRGGTVLMPGVRLLDDATDFPKNGPALIITDGMCDKLTIRRDHAYLLAQGGRLAFPAKGPVFRFS